MVDCCPSLPDEFVPRARQRSITARKAAPLEDPRADNQPFNNRRGRTQRLIDADSLVFNESVSRLLKFWRFLAWEHDSFGTNWGKVNTQAKSQVKIAGKDGGNKVDDV